MEKKSLYIGMLLGFFILIGIIYLATSNKTDTGRLSGLSMADDIGIPIDSNITNITEKEKEEAINTSLYEFVSPIIKRNYNSSTGLYTDIIGNFGVMLDTKDNTYRNFTDVVKMKVEGNKIIVEWNGRKETVEFGFLMLDKTELSLDSAVSTSNIKTEFPIYDKESSYTFDLNISNTGILSSTIDGVYIKSDKGVIKNNELYFDDIKINLGDAIDTGLTVSSDKDSLIITNLADKTNIFIDPSFISNLSAVADVHITGAAGNSFESYVKFDISSLPSDADITNAKLGMWASAIVSIGSNVYGHNCTNQTWTELNIANRVFDCGGRAYTYWYQGISVAVTTTKWKIWTMTTQVDYSRIKNNNYVTFMLINSAPAAETVEADLNRLYVIEPLALGSDGVHFNSSEATAVSSQCGGMTGCRPYLQISYTSPCTCPSTPSDWEIGDSNCYLTSDCNIAGYNLNIDGGSLTVPNGRTLVVCTMNTRSGIGQVYKGNTGVVLKSC